MRLRYRSRSLAACAITPRTSFTVADTALSSTNRRSVIAAAIRARLVLPVPGDPHSTTDHISSRSSASRSGAPGPTRSACPLKSSSDRGRIRAASGIAAFCASAPACANRSSVIRRGLQGPGNVGLQAARAFHSHGPVQAPARSGRPCTSRSDRPPPKSPQHSARPAARGTRSALPTVDRYTPSAEASSTVSA